MHVIVRVTQIKVHQVAEPNRINFNFQIIILRNS